MTNEACSKQSGLLGRAYRLTLGSVSWQLRAGEGLEDWLARLARILELEPEPEDSSLKPGERRIYFVRSELKDLAGSSWKKLDELSFPDCPRTGWQKKQIHPLQLWTHPQSPSIICQTVIDDSLSPDMPIEAMMRVFYPVFEELIEAGGGPLHAALVSRDGFGVALAASGGTGKSTCARRIPAPWSPICDDTVLIIPDGHQGYVAHPSPTWSDYLWRRSERTWRISDSVPLRAVFFLKQAEEDKASAIGQGEAAIYLSRSMNDILIPFSRRLSPEENRAFEHRVFDNVCRLAKALPAFVLEARLEGEFWKEMDRILAVSREDLRESNGRDRP